MRLMKENNIKVDLHVSTQASTLNYEVAKFYKEEFGATRVVLAREASKEDIERFMKKQEWKLNVSVMELCVHL